MFNSKLRKKNEQLEQENEELHNTVSVLLKEIKRRDEIIEKREQTISSIMQKQITEDSKSKDPTDFEFPGTEKGFNSFWASFTDYKKL